MEDPTCNNPLNYSFKDVNDVTHADTPFCHTRVHSDLINSTTANTSIYQSPISRFGSPPYPSGKKLFRNKDSQEKVPEFIVNTATFNLSRKLKMIEEDHPKSKSDFSVKYALNNPSESFEAGEIDYSKGNKEIPTLLWCAYCKGEMTTVVKYVNTSMTFFSSLGIFLSGGIFGCFLLPYMTNSCKSPQLLCRNCERVLSN